MRITTSMLNDRVISNLDTTLNHLMRLETMMSTGKRINTPSDDPSGAQKSMRYRQILANLEQYQSNISTSLNTLKTYDSGLIEMKNMVTDAYETAVSLANGHYDANSRIAAADTVESNLDALMSLINAKDSGKYIYSGFQTNRAAFEMSANGVEYVGDYGNFQVEIDDSSKTGINLIGADILLEHMSIPGEDSNLEVGIDFSTLLADLHGGNGIDQSVGTFEVTDNNNGISTTVDVSTATSVANLIIQVNVQLAAAGMTNVSLDLGEEGNNLRWVTTNNNQVTMTTPLNNLNNGAGIDNDNGRFLIQNDSLSINVDVDITSAATLGDVINEINSSLTSSGVNNVTASLNAAGTGIDITDTNGVPLGLSVVEFAENSTTASTLGITGSIGPVLNGNDLSPALDFSVAESGADQSTASDLGLLGGFGAGHTGDGLEPILTVDTPLALLKNGLGMDWGELKISQGSDVAYVDLDNPAFNTVQDLLDAINNSGLEIAATINENQTGIQIDSTSNIKSLKIEDVGDGRIASDMGIYGSPDIMGSMMLLIDALRNDNSDAVAQIIGSLENGIDSLLTNVGAVGAKQSRLESTSSRLNDMQYNNTVLLSDNEDADLTKLVSDLAVQENAYQAALIAASKIIQPSLVNFLS